MKKTIKLLVVFMVLACVSVMMFACVQEPEAATKYMVTFANEDGKVLQSGEVEAGALPEYKGETPTKASDEAYDYTFDGWDAELAAVTGEVTYTAKYVKVAREYTITFKNGDEVLWTGKVAYGETPSYTGTPEKESTDDVVYIFAGWDSEVVKVVGDATYNAKFTAIPTEKSYKAKFVNWDGTVLQDESFVKVGEEPEYKGETPTKAGDAQYSYVFKEWSKTVVNEETGDVVMTAVFDQKVNQYTIKFVNWDDSAIEGLDDLVLDYGAKITLPEGITPTRPNSATCGYIFAKWEPELTAETVVTGDATYKATYTETEFQFKYTFYDENGTTVLKVASIAASASVVAPADPTKAADAQYSYTFDGWYTAKTGGDKVTEFGKITADTVYYARYTSAVNQYTVKFVDDAGNPITGIADQKADYGTAIIIPEAITKADDATASYKFDGWYAGETKLEAGAIITGDVTYTAKFTVDTYKNYTITFMNGETEVSKKTDCHYGDAITAPAAPTKNSDAQYSYTFDGWYNAETGGDKVTEFGTVSGNATYYARFTTETRTYTINFVDYDGTELSSAQVAYGTVPTAPEAPAGNKDAGAKWIGTFKGWDTEVVEVTGDTTYTATYNETAWTEIDYNPLTVAQNGKHPVVSEAASSDETAAYGYTNKYLYTPLEWTNTSAVANLVEGAEKIKFYLDATNPYAEFGITMFAGNTGFWQVLDPNHPIVLEKTPEGKYKVFAGDGRYNGVEGTSVEVDSLSQLTFNVNGNGNTDKGVYISNIMYIGENAIINVPKEYKLDAAPFIKVNPNHYTVTSAPATEDEQALGIETTYTFTMSQWTQAPIFCYDLDATMIRFFYKTDNTAWLGYSGDNGSTWERYIGAGQAVAGQWIEYILIRNTSGTYDVFTPKDGVDTAVQKLDATYNNTVNTAGMTNVAVNGGAGTSFTISNLTVIHTRDITVEDVKAENVLATDSNAAPSEITVSDISADAEAQNRGIKTAVQYAEAGWSSPSVFTDIAATDARIVRFYVKHTKGTSAFNLTYNGTGSYQFHTADITQKWIEVLLISNGTSFDLYVNGAAWTNGGITAGSLTNLNQLGLQNHDTSGGSVLISNMTVVK